MRQVRASKRLPQLVNELDRDGRKIVDEIEWILDLVRNTGSQLPERGKLLRLNKAILRGPQVLQRLGQFARAALDTLEQPRILYRQHRLRREGLQQPDRALRELARLLAADHQRADDPIGTEKWHD